MQEQTPQRKKLYLLVSELGLNRIERLEIAEYLLRRDVSSFDSLDEDEVLRMLDALNGALLVLEQFRQRVRILDPIPSTDLDEASGRPEQSDGEGSLSAASPSDDAGQPCSPSAPPDAHVVVASATRRHHQQHSC